MKKIISCKSGFIGVAAEYRTPYSELALLFCRGCFRQIHRAVCGHFWHSVDYVCFHCHDLSSLSQQPHQLICKGAEKLHISLVWVLCCDIQHFLVKFVLACLFFFFFVFSEADSLYLITGALEASERCLSEQVKLQDHSAFSDWDEQIKACPLISFLFGFVEWGQAKRHFSWLRSEKCIL